MSVDDTARSIFATKRPPLGLLVAGRATEMLAAGLDDEARATFDALAKALEGWWPDKARDAEEIFHNELAACVAAAEAGGVAFAPAMHAANVQMRAFLEVRPKSLPAGVYYDMDAENLVKALRDGAKAIKLPLAQLDARLKLLLENKKDKWPKLVERTRRMRWSKGAAWGKLDKRVRDLASLADLGAAASWQQVGAQSALRLELDDIKRITVLKPEELEALRAVVPSIPAPPTA